MVLCRVMYSWENGYSNYTQSILEIFNGDATSHGPRSLSKKMICLGNDIYHIPGSRKVMIFSFAPSEHATVVLTAARCE